MNLTRNLSFILLSTALTLPVFAHEISIGAGALSSLMVSRLTYKEIGYSNTQVSPSSTATSGEFYVGYAYNINSGFDIGLEIYYDLGGPEIEQNIVTEGYVKNSVKNTMGLRIVPGLNITPSTRVFVEVGYAFLETEIDIADTITVTPFATTSETKKGNALEYGAGIETMFYQSMGIRAGYRVMNGAQAIAKITSIDESVSYKGKPNLNQFYLGGIFRFGF